MRRDVTSGTDNMNFMRWPVGKAPSFGAFALAKWESLGEMRDCRAQCPPSWMAFDERTVCQPVSNR